MISAGAKPEPGSPRRPPGGGCLLTGLANPRLGGVLPGLVLEEGHLEVAKAAFGCCGGEGLRYDPSQNLTLSCVLSTRLKLVRAVREQHWRAKEGLDLATELSPQGFAPVLARLSALASGQTRKGLTFLAPESPTRPLSVWSVALAAAWRFGLTPHVVSLGSSSAGELCPRFSAAAPGLVLVEGVTRLWEAPLAEALELLVGYCYGAMVPLFLDVVWTEAGAERRGGEGPAVRSTRAAFGAKLQRVKAQGAATWLSPACVAKLAQVTEAPSDWLAPEKPRGRSR